MSGGALTSAGERDSLVAHARSELHCEVPEPTDTEHCYPSTRGHRSAAYCVERRHPGAPEWRGYVERHAAWYVRDSVHRDRDKLRPPSGIAHARRLPFGTVHHVSGPAEPAVSATAAEPSHRNMLAHLNRFDVRSHCRHRTGDFMAGRNREP